LIGGADVCVSASTWQEAFGLGVLEPMSLGKAVVATAVGGVPEILRDGESGFLVPAADEARLEDAINRLLADPALRTRLGKAGRERAKTHFTIQAQIALLSAIIAQGLGA
jgi:glycosyltransferase involved in cell wall biosynthesis